MVNLCEFSVFKILYRTVSAEPCLKITFVKVLPRPWCLKLQYIIGRPLKNAFVLSTNNATIFESSRCHNTNRLDFSWLTHDLRIHGHTLCRPEAQAYNLLNQLRKTHFLPYNLPNCALSRLSSSRAILYIG